MNLSVTARQLRAFLALAETRHFTRAAQSIPLSQPAFSASISTLEKAVGAPLFQRDTRKVTLTAAGLAFEGPARRAVRELEIGLDGVRGLLEHRHGKASVAMLPSLAAGWLPQVLAAFTHAHPGITLQVADVLSERVIELVRSGQVDFGIAAKAAEDHDLSSVLLASDRFELVCRRDHRLADAPRISVRDLSNECLIAQARYSIVGRYLQAELRPGLAPRLMEVEQLATVIGLVRAGMGIAAIPQFNLFDFHYPDLVRRALDFSGLERRLFVIRPSGRPLSTAAQALHDWLLENRPRVNAGARVRSRRRRS